MDLLILTISITVFLFSASLVALAYLLWVGRFGEKRTIKNRLLYLSAGGGLGLERLTGYRNGLLKNANPVERFAFSLPRIQKLDRMLVKARVPLNATAFILLSLTLGGIGTLLGLWLLPIKFTAIVLGALFFFIPFLILRWAEKASDARFEEQLPAATDLMARALRAGHAFSSALEMVSQEMDEPIKSQFRAAVDEMKLGLTFSEALENLCNRVPSMDLRFFAVSVIIQKETGGNIAEILDRIGALIRERTQFRRNVKTLTAEGRLSGNILISIPIILFVYLYFINNDYIALLWTDPIGTYFISGAIVLQILGVYFIKRLVKIEI
ncbi:MAG TPA: type II secretion system F family protein [Desulfuromonadales bacterium]|nr:type II secretion system F family protein [Desulfuromonadales bacterium]